MLSTCLVTQVFAYASVYQCQIHNEMFIDLLFLGGTEAITFKKISTEWRRISKLLQRTDLRI